MTSPKRNNDASTATDMFPTTPKKQRIVMEAQDHTTIQPGPLRRSTCPQPPFAQIPQVQPQQQSGQMNSGELTHKLLNFVLKTTPGLLPGNPATTAITSAHINETAHAMWQTAFATPGVLDQVCTYAAMFSILKLAALAKLNYLPSWWFLREAVCRIMINSQWNVDDAAMQTEWMSMVDWCRRHLPGLAPKRTADAATAKDQKNKDVIEVEDNTHDVETFEE